MLLMELTSQLGNQMFCYASAKAIAQKQGYEFKCFRKPISKEFINDSDKKYGSDLTSVFKIPDDEILVDLQLRDSLKVLKEPPFQKLRNSVYQKEIANCSDNTKISGYLISTRYFEDMLPQVRNWFAFHDDTWEEIQKEAERLRRIAGTRKICAVHFRVGDDYFKQGYKISEKYQIKAARCARKYYGDENVLFVVFYDRKKGEISRFEKKFSAEISHNSMIVDMGVISLCDAAIISNSSFAIWSALLSKNVDFKVWRPSKYPIIMGYTPDDCFLESWESVPARREFFSGIYMYLRNFASRIKHFICNKK